MRLQKFLANAGIASRRKCEEYIVAGRVEVNGTTIKEPGFLVDPAADEIKYMSKPIKIPEEKIYIMLNKPAGCVSTCSDEKGRETIMRYIKDIRERLYPVGRLDFNSEGLLIMTNDGELANRLTHPKHNVPKKYLAVIDGEIGEDDIEKLSSGVIIDKEYKTAPATFVLLNSSPLRSEALCIITEGKNRQIRKMFEAIGKNVKYLKRVAVGDLKLGNLKKGTYRHLTPEEVTNLKKL